MKRKVIVQVMAMAVLVVGAIQTPRAIGNGGSALSVSSASTAAQAEVWWPAQNVTITGAQPFKAIVKDKQLSSYRMYWQVDGGQPNSMYDSTQDYPHKEAIVDVSGWTWKGAGPYVITFVAQNISNDSIIARQNVSIQISQPVTSVTTQMPQTSSVAPSTTSTAPKSTGVTNTDTPKPADTSTQVSSSTGNPLAGSKLYVNPNSPIRSQANAWKASRPADAEQLEKIANQGEVQWFGDWNSNIRDDVSSATKTIASAGALPIYVAYNIPSRDCGGYSAGGVQSASAYKAWISSFAAGIGNQKAAVILEPDALALIDCLSSSEQQTRYDLLNYAVTTLRANGKTAVYLDAGHSSWINATEMANRLNKAGIASANGFVLNISNFQTNANSTLYGQNVSRLTGNKHFIIDTSRNGKGPTLDAQWCNPPGRALGSRPTVQTNNALIDAFLWVKKPGESDGQCNGGPSAGTWWPEYALQLAQNASY
jgi:endoglucanase